MDERKIFSGLGLVKKEVTEKFLLATRYIYEKHPAYTYHDDEDKTKILIYPSYANPEYDGKQPRLLVKVGSYNYHLKDTLFNNMSREKIADGVVSGYEHQQMIPISLRVWSQAYAEEESSDIADEFATLVAFAYRRIYNYNGLVVRGVQVSETDLYNQEQGIYQTPISVSLDIPWRTEEYNSDPPLDIEIEGEIAEDLYFDTYKQPGVRVSVVKDKRV